MSATTAGIVLLAAGAALATLTAWAWWTDAHPATGRHHATTRWQRARGAWHATTRWQRARGAWHATTRWQRARGAWHATTGWARARHPQHEARDAGQLQPLPDDDTVLQQWDADRRHLPATPGRIRPAFAAQLAAHLIAARWLVREAERLATRPWAEETGAFARTALTDMLAGAV